MSLSFVFVFQEIAVAPLSSAEASARYPSENSNKRAGNYWEDASSLPLPIVPARFLFPSPQSPCETKRPLRRRKAVAHSEKNENLRLPSTPS